MQTSQIYVYILQKKSHVQWPLSSSNQSYLATSRYKSCHHRNQHWKNILASHNASACKRGGGGVVLLGFGPELQFLRPIQPIKK